MPDERTSRILNVDDNDAGRYTTTKILKKAGFEVIEAANGSDALTRAASQHPDLVLLDVNLPDISGFEVCKRLKEDEKTALIPVVHVSATYVNIRDRVQGLEGGADGYLVHPIEPEELVASIRSFIRSRYVEKTLRESEGKYRLLFDEMLSGFALHEIICDPSGTPADYRFLSVNAMFETITGLNASDILGKTVLEVLPGTELSWIDRYGKVALTGEPTQFENYAAALGKYFEVRAYCPEHGKFATLINDITERKRTEKVLRESEERYRRLFDSAKDGILILNRDTSEIIDANPFINSLTGYAKEELIGKKVREVGFFSDQFASKFFFEELQKKEYIRYDDLPLKTKEGKRIDVEFISNIFSIDQNLSVIQCSIRDITDRKAMELQREALIRELAQKNAELERFTYTVSHELKSPLITIRMFADLLEEDAQKGDPLQMKKDISRITAAAGTMHETLTDLLELSRIGGLAKTRERIPFGTIVHEAVDRLATSLVERGAKVEIAPDLPVVNVDHGRIREVMVNLIENGIKFSGDRPDPVIRIGMDRDGTTPFFFVQDNGIGIDPRYLERIFNLFERLDVSVHGTGIGLTISRRIIEVHGGKIWADSEGPGKGTTFRFTLPGGTEEAEMV